MASLMPCWADFRRSWRRAIRRIRERFQWRKSLSAVRERTGIPLVEAVGPAEAIREALRLTPPNGLICVTGSLFLAAEARAVVLGLPSIPQPLPTG